MKRTKTSFRAGLLVLLMGVSMMIGGCKGENKGEPTIPVSSVTLTPAEKSLLPGGTLSLTAKILPENATNRSSGSLRTSRSLPSAPRVRSQP